MAGKDSHPEGGKERELRLRHTNKKYSTHNRKKSLRNVIRSQYLKYIGHVCRCPNTMMTEKMLFAKLKRPHKRDPWIDISRGVNVSIEQAQSTLWYIVGSRGVEWWERSPTTYVFRVRFPDPASYVSWVCCWFSSLLWGFFCGFSGFPPSSKTNISKFQFDQEFEGHGFISLRLLCVTLVKQSWFIYLFYLKEPGRKWRLICGIYLKTTLQQCNFWGNKAGNWRNSLELDLVHYWCPLKLILREFNSILCKHFLLFWLKKHGRW